MNSYDLSRNWFDWCFENPEKISPNHTAMYFFIIEHCNRLGWKEKFGLPATMVKDAIGIKSYNTYKKTLNDLVDWGFIILIQESKNQYSSNIVALSKKVKALNKALDKALIKHTSKQSESTRQSIDSIDKQETNKQKNNETNNKLVLFESWWRQYDNKKGKDKAEEKWLRLSFDEIQACLDVVSKYVKSTPDKNFRKNPLTYLNGKCWKDEITIKTQDNGTIKQQSINHEDKHRTYAERVLFGDGQQSQTEQPNGGFEDTDFEDLSRQ